MTNPSKWKYYTEKGLRKRKLKIVTITGPQARALCNDSVDLTSSCRKGVFELYMEETL